MLTTILNILWFILGGVITGLSWWIIGVLAFLTVVGIPWSRACFVIGYFSFFPVGKEAIDRAELSGEEDIGTGVFGTLGNIIWFLFAGLWLAILHVLAAISLAITIIGIPFAIQHLKLAGIALAPIGKTVVEKEVAQAARESAARREVARIRGEE